MTADVRWEILNGLPAYGPMAEPFTATGKGTHSEGLVVKFKNSTESWVGNFQRGFSSLDKVLQHPNGHLVVVVAGGTAYVVDPRTRSLMQHFGQSNAVMELVVWRRQRLHFPDAQRSRNVEAGECQGHLAAGLERGIGASELFHAVGRLVHERTSPFLAAGRAFADQG